VFCQVQYLCSEGGTGGVDAGGAGGVPVDAGGTNACTEKKREKRRDRIEIIYCLLKEFVCICYLLGFVFFSLFFVSHYSSRNNSFNGKLSI